MSASTLTCHCRHCGFALSYSAENAGLDARCTRCGQTIRLPGRLAKIASIRGGRRNDRLGLAAEIGGFAAMFFFFPWGLVAGVILVVAGWRRSNALFCGSCGTRLKSRKVPQCPKCRAKFASE